MQYTTLFRIHSQGRSSIASTIRLMVLKDERRKTGRWLSILLLVPRCPRSPQALHLKRQLRNKKEEGGIAGLNWARRSMFLPFYHSCFFLFFFVSLSHRFVLLRIYISPSNEWQDQVTAMLRAKVKVKAASNNGNKHGDNKDGKVLGRADSRAMRMQSRTRSASGSSVKGGMYHLVSPSPIPPPVHTPKQAPRATEATSLFLVASFFPFPHFSHVGTGKKKRI